MPLFVSFLPKTQLHNGVKYFLKEHSYLMNLHFHEIFIKESHWKSKKVYKKRKQIINPQKNRGKNSWKIGRPIFALLPTPLVPFCPILLDPPSPLKIGHHLCTFPYLVQLFCFDIVVINLCQAQCTHLPNKTVTWKLKCS